jgi:hypothetical protein
LLLAVSVLGGGFLAAQTYRTPLPTVSDKDVALLRQNLQAESKKIVEKNMQLNDAEAASFWPLYNEYTAETRKVNDTRFGLVKDHARIYKTMTAGEADNMTRLLAPADEEIINLRLQYLPKFGQVPPGTKAALFMQLDRRLDSSSMCRLLRSSQPSNHSNQGQLQPCR